MHPKKATNSYRKSEKRIQLVRDGALRERARSWKAGLDWLVATCISLVLIRACPEGSAGDGNSSKQLPWYRTKTSEIGRIRREIHPIFAGYGMPCDCLAAGMSEWSGRESSPHGARDVGFGVGCLLAVLAGFSFRTHFYQIPMLWDRNTAVSACAAEISRCAIM